MKITFGNNIDNKPKVRFNLLIRNALKVPTLTDEQVKQINETRKLPEGYHCVYNLDKYGRGSYIPKYEMTITKGLPKLHPLQEPFYFDTLQNGYELENYKGKTYLRESGTTVKEIKSQNRINSACGLISCALLLLLGIIIGKKVPKK